MYSCDITNKQKVSRCVERFIVDELNCKPPWFKDSHGDINNCTGQEKYEIYTNITRNIRSLAPKCFETKNCVQQKWFTQDFMTGNSSFPNTTVLQYNLQSTVSLPIVLSIA